MLQHLLLFWHYSFLNAWRLDCSVSLFLAKYTRGHVLLFCQEQTDCSVYIKVTGRVNPLGNCLLILIEQIIPERCRYGKTGPLVTFSAALLTTISLTNISVGLLATYIWWRYYTLRWADSSRSYRSLTHCRSQLVFSRLSYYRLTGSFS